MISTDQQVIKKKLLLTTTGACWRELASGLFAFVIGLVVISAGRPER